MKKIVPQSNWHDSWKFSYPFDLLEIYGSLNNHGYAYAYANRRRHTLELIQKIAQPGAKILDLAAAQGNFSLILAELGYEVTWNDLREELIDYVELKRESGNIHYAPGNVFDLGFASEFDVVLIAEVIEHVAHPDEFLKKIAEMIKPNGYIVMTTPNGEYFLNRLPKFSDCPDPSQFESIQFQPNADGHIFLLYLDEIEDFAKQIGLSILDARLITNSITNGHIKSRYLLKFLPRQWVESLESFTEKLPLPLRKKIHTAFVVLIQRRVESV
ncbi:methyltransferase domain-containing protein [Anabaena catenula]|uniref:Methyltransferase domain-containing protein n=1 Tax=Anabaena catenula FACHB-362 TaxID=2692877 RepID=A0ABR8J3T7_9NOST|nr:methyltransferase domain-containing protein [Anabaena catenula FACHB-362]